MSYIPEKSTIFLDNASLYLPTVVRKSKLHVNHSHGKLYLSNFMLTRDRKLLWRLDPIELYIVIKCAVRMFIKSHSNCIFQKVVKQPQCGYIDRIAAQLSSVKNGEELLFKRRPNFAEFVEKQELKHKNKNFIFCSNTYTK